jgi:hypothetical protein
VGQQPSGVLIGSGSCGEAGLARVDDVGRVAQPPAGRLPDRQGGLGPLGDQPALLLREGGVEVEHERIRVAAEFGHNE